MALSQLPPELLLRMSDHLTTSELGHLRLTCKAVESTLFDTFAKEFTMRKRAARGTEKNSSEWQT